MSARTDPAIAAAIAAAAQHPVAYQALRVFINNSNVAIQPKDRPSGDAAALVETLSIDLESGSVQVLLKPMFPGQGVVILGVLGLSKLHKGYALVVITAAQRVATVQGCDVFRVAAADIMTGRSGAATSENRNLVKLLKDAVDPEGSGRDMFFSYTYDITLSAQRLAAVLGNPEAANRPLAARADPRFTWNRALIKPLVDANAARFVMPAILGFVRQLPKLSFVRPGRPSAGSATLTLIARRSPNRAGTRHWRRGADGEGNVANYVETEQLLTLDSAAASLSSFVEIRGSIPLLWTQLPNIKYKPPTVIASRFDCIGPFDRHFKSQVDQYKNVVAINLINQHGSEGKLEVAFRQEAERFITGHKAGGLRYIAFDFHKECGESRYHRLSVLWDQISADFNTHGFFLLEKGVVVRRQEGVMRINCIDCLDRTNVLQSVYGRKALEMVLKHFDLLPTSGTLPETFPQVEQEFKVLWADHGDHVSTQYAGTGAMKSGFTRTGKRTFGGKLDDGVKALTRYYLNNFQDGRKQDAVDLFTGHYAVDPKISPPIRSQPSPLVPVLLAFLIICYSLHTAGHLLLPAAKTVTEAALGGERDAVVGGLLQLLTALLRGVLVPLALAVGVIVYVFANGKFLVNRPQLCPQLAYTVNKQSAAGAKMISTGKSLPGGGAPPGSAGGAAGPLGGR